MNCRMNSLGDEDLEKVSGGVYFNDTKDLKHFVTCTVCNVINYRLDSCLEMCLTPNGKVIPGVSWVNGEAILVHKDYNEGGWLFAYKDGHYGFVSSNNVR